MGYFSNFDLEIKEKFAEKSYYSFDEQLMDRFNDLKERYFDLLAQNAPFTSDTYFSYHDFCYAPIDTFESISDIYRALEINAERLRDECDVSVSVDFGKKIEPAQVKTEADPIQLEIAFIPMMLHRMAV